MIFDGDEVEVVDVSARETSSLRRPRSINPRSSRSSVGVPEREADAGARVGIGVRSNLDSRIRIGVGGKGFSSMRSGSEPYGSGEHAISIIVAVAANRPTASQCLFPKSLNDQ